MTYTETIDYLFSRLPMFSKMGAAAIKTDLVNTIKICSWLGNPKRNLKPYTLPALTAKDRAAI